jgi:protein O-GlcNAc transferase
MTRGGPPTPGDQQTPAQHQEAAAINAMLLQAVAHVRRGELAQAERLYLEILATAPACFDALHFLASIRYREGRYEASASLFQQAIEASPGRADAYSNLGLAHEKLQRSEQALANYDSALALKPGFAEAINNRGNALATLGRQEEALASYDRALALKPGYVAALYNRGSVLQHLGQHDEALASYDRALSINPRFVEALSNRGNVLQALGRREEALASHDRALELAPGYAEAFYNRGNVLRQLNRDADALSSYDRALALKPDLPDAFFNRGNLLRDLGRYNDALTSYDRALALRPDFVTALYNRGNVLRGLNRHEDALVSYDRALALEASNAEALNNRGNALATLKRYDEALTSYDKALAVKHDFAVALYNRGNALWELQRYRDAAATFSQLIASVPEYDYAIGWLLTCQMQCCDWESAARDIEHITTAVERGARAILPFAFLAASPSAAAYLKCARTYVAYRFPASPIPVWTDQRHSHDKIRVAYLSADFHNHATAYLMAGLFETHDKRRFETVGVSFGPDARDEMRERLLRTFDRFVDVRRMGDREVAQMLCEWEIDVVVDIKGFANDCRTGILSHRPAPIQVNYLGWPGTMGADYIDYIIADGHVIPPGHESFYAEKIVRLPDTYQANDSRRRIAEETPRRAEVNLPDAGFVFCCFNNNYKIRPEIYDIWMRLLSQVPNSVLWLLQDNAVAVQNLRRHAEQRGVVAERVVFAPRVGLDKHLARHRLADLFLDTLPYNAHTTASDALWAGLPVLTCTGSAFAGRVAGSLLHAVGLPELITQDLEDYERMALTLATSPDMLSDIRNRLAQNRKTYPLFDTDRLRRHIESAYTTMWERHRRGEPPAGFAVQCLP